MHFVRVCVYDYFWWPKQHLGIIISYSQNVEVVSEKNIVNILK